MRKRARSFTGDPHGFVARSGAAPLVLVSIDVTPNAPDVDEGLTVQLTATGTYEDFSTRDITASSNWTTSNGSIATVVAGLCTGVNDGSCTITATKGAISGNETLTVNPVASRQTIVMSNVTTADSSTDGTVFNTAAFAPVSGQQYFVGVMSTSVAESPTLVHDGFSGGFATVGTARIGATARQLTVFEGVADSTTSDTITFTFPSTQASTGWTVVTGTGIDTTTPVVGAPVTANSASSVTTLNTTLPGFEHANNVHLAFVILGGNLAVTPDPDFVELGDADGFAANTGDIESQWATNTLACDPSWTSTTCAQFSIEVKSAP